MLYLEHVYIIKPMRNVITLVEQLRRRYLTMKHVDGIIMITISFVMLTQS